MIKEGSRDVLGEVLGDGLGDGLTTFGFGGAGGSFAAPATFLRAMNRSKRLLDSLRIELVTPKLREPLNKAAISGVK